MDPVACIIAYMECSQSRADTVAALRGWYAKGGFRPTLVEILASADARGIALPAGWGARALRLGAVR